VPERKHIIYDRHIEPANIVVIKPFNPNAIPDRDLADEDLNATVVLTSKPKLVHARRPVKVLAEQLGFVFISGSDPSRDVAVDPAAVSEIRPFVAIGADAKLRWGYAQTLLILKRGGMDHRLHLAQAPDIVTRAVDSCTRPDATKPKRHHAPSVSLPKSRLRPNR